MNEDLTTVIQQALFYASPLSEETDLNTSGSGIVTSETFTTYDCSNSKYSSLQTCSTELSQNSDASVEYSDVTRTQEVIDGLVFDRCNEYSSFHLDKEKSITSGRERQFNIEYCNLDNEQIERSCDIFFNDDSTNDFHDRDDSYHKQDDGSSSQSTLVAAATEQVEVTSSSSPGNPEISTVHLDPVTTKVKKTRKRIKNPDPYPDPILPPCIICNEKASGFHYGANTCEACKGFFRRTLKKDKSRLKCKCRQDMEGQWKHGPVRNGCSSCRFNRCLEEGMSIDAIKIGRYTIKHRTENINQIKSAEAKDEAEVPESSPSSISGLRKRKFENSPSSTIDTRIPPTTSHDNITSSTEIETSLISTSSQTDFDELSPVTKKAKILNNDLTSEEKESIVEQLTEAQTNSCLVETCNVPIEIIKQKQTDYLEKYNMKKQMFGDMVLSNEEFQEFYNITGIDLDGRIQHMAGAFNYIERKILKMVDFAKSIPGFKRLSLNDQANLIKASRMENSLFGGYKARYRNMDMETRVITTPWGKEIHLDELGRIHPIDGILHQYKLCRLLTDLNLTVKEDAVLRAIVTMYSDRCSLEEPDKVEHIQEKLVTCLQHLLNIRSSGSLLYKIFNFLTNLRNFSENEHIFRQSLLRDYPMLATNRYQLLKEFLS